MTRALNILKIKDDQQLLKIIESKEDAFMADNWYVGCTHLLRHKIITSGEPINVKPYRQPMNLESKIEEAIKNLFENNIIRKCNSPWNTPLIYVWKRKRRT